MAAKMGFSKPTSTPHTLYTIVCALWASRGLEMVSRLEASRFIT